MDIRNRNSECLEGERLDLGQEKESKPHGGHCYILPLYQIHHITILSFQTFDKNHLLK